MLLSTAYGNSGISGALAVSDSILRMVESHRDQLTRWERLAVDFSRAGFNGDVETQFRVVRTASARNPEWLWLYLTAAMGVNRNYPELAVKSLKAVTNPSPDSSWVPYWATLATAYHQLGDFKSELRAANHADSLHHGELFQERLRATAASGDTTGVRRLIDSVATFSSDSVNTPGNWMYIAALELRAHQYHKAADTMLAHARIALTGLPPGQTRRSQRVDAAAAFLAMGQFDSAYARYVDLARDTTDIISRARVGVSAAGMHDTVTAKRILDELATVRIPYRKSEPTFWRAAIAAQLGDKALAVRLLRQSMQEGRGVGSDMHRRTEFQSLRGYPAFEEILRPKG